MRFNLIREPEENPTDLLKSYRQQNIIMQKIRVLHTAFDGIKLTNWSDSNRELPNILIGSVCEFGGRLFEATDNIVLTDNDKADGERFIRLEIVRENPTADSDGDYLIAEVVSSEMPEYDYYNRGFYSKVDGVIKYKYLRVSMKYDKTLGGYVEKKYWNISDLMRAGITFKKHSVSFGVGTHNFNVPDNANSITVHLVSGGGGGASAHFVSFSGATYKTTYGAKGGNSQIIINNITIVNCGGGGGGVGRGEGQAGGGGIVTYDKEFHVDYVNGKPGLSYWRGSAYGETGSNGGILIYNSNLMTGGYGGGAHRYADENVLTAYNAGGGGGAGSCAIISIDRIIFESSKTIKIVVGAGGAGGGYGSKGQDGSAVVEYFSRG